MRTCLHAINLWLMIAVVIPLASWADDQPHPSHGPSRSIPFDILHKDDPAPDFDLIDQNGRRVRLQDLRGTPVILTFFHTTCRDYCPLILKGRARLEAGARDVVGDHPVFLAITFDPETDTPEVLRSFIEQLQLDTDRLHLLTGDVHEVRRVLEAYRVQANTSTDGTEVVNHTLIAYAIDGNGIVQKVLVFNF